ncbi:MAG TPA: haloacid dehalogenase type II [Dongiaceae bacterium]|jgi:2-haloacid dehalogenase
MRAALFDVFGTVVDWRSGVMRDVAQFTERHAISGINHGTFADAWRRRYSPSMEEIRAGRRPFVSLDFLHLENLHATLSEFDIAPRDFSEAELLELNRAWHRLDPWRDVLAGLHQMKSRIVIAPLSNGNVSLLLNMAKRASIPWDAILGAEVVKAYKPTPEAYLRTASLLDLPTNQIVMVAAHNGDLSAARASGMRTAFVPRPTEHGPDQTTDLTPAQKWDFVATDFKELAQQFAL